jgi:hypothetical protein
MRYQSVLVQVHVSQVSQVVVLRQGLVEVAELEPAQSLAAAEGLVNMSLLDHCHYSCHCCHCCHWCHCHCDGDDDGDEMSSS